LAFLVVETVVVDRGGAGRCGAGRGVRLISGLALLRPRGLLGLLRLTLMLMLGLALRILRLLPRLLLSLLRLPALRTVAAGSSAVSVIRVAGLRGRRDVVV